MAHDSRLALVTGAAGGIGEAIAARLARDGLRVVLCDISPAVIRTADRLAATALVGDVSDEAWVKASIAALASDHGGVDVLVNNAAISPKHNGKKAPVAQLALAEWQSVLAVNLTGPFLLCRACLPGMQAKGWGRIINIASQTGRVRADIAGSHYAASKAGLMGFSRVLAGEVGKTGVTVNCVAPGRIETAMGVIAGAAATEAYVAATPVGRMGQPVDVAEACAFLASPAAGFITGTTIDVNGGYSMN